MDWRFIFCLAQWKIVVEDNNKKIKGIRGLLAHLGEEEKGKDKRLQAK